MRDLVVFLDTRLRCERQLRVTRRAFVGLVVGAVVVCLWRLTGVCWFVLLVAASLRSGRGKRRRKNERRSETGRPARRTVRRIADSKGGEGKTKHDCLLKSALTSVFGARIIIARLHTHTMS